MKQNALKVFYDPLNTSYLFSEDNKAPRTMMFCERETEIIIIPAGRETNEFMQKFLATAKPVNKTIDRSLEYIQNKNELRARLRTPAKSLV